MKGATKIIPRKPVFFGLLKLFFPAIGDNTIIAFGDTIYAKDPLSKDKIVHEQVHLEQHKYSNLWAIIYLIRYRLSKRFRLKSEIEAFHEQYSVSGDWILEKAAKILSGKLYGEIISYKDAKEAIKKGRLDN